MQINSRSDLDALDPEDRARFMQTLAGSIYRIERDDENQTWVAIEDLNTIQRFGFTREDFPDAIPPALPEWIAPPDPRAEISCTDLQALLALDAMGLAEAYESWSTDPVRTFAEKAFISRARTWKRLDATFNAAADALGKTEIEKDEFFALAGTF